ncbi:MAG: WbqC family protein, partial [Crocinitomicaceae bacterium]|nr:WbqC family protein [Crocinitomicaceae bacterium]
MTAVFPSAYFPCISYLKAYLAHEKRSIELFEHYPKQTLRNRCDIATSNGKLRLSIPIKKPFGSKSLMKDILIDQDAQWQKEHWRSIRTAYAGAPYFEEYAHDIEALIN